MGGCAWELAGCWYACDWLLGYDVAVCEWLVLGYDVAGCDWFSILCGNVEDENDWRELDDLV